MGVVVVVVIRTERPYLVLSLTVHENPQARGQGWEREEERWRYSGVPFLCPIIPEH